MVTLPWMPSSTGQVGSLCGEVETCQRSVGSGMQSQQLLSIGICKQLSVLPCKKRLCRLEEGEDTLRGSGPQGSPIPRVAWAPAVLFSQRDERQDLGTQHSAPQSAIVPGEGAEDTEAS